MTLIRILHIANESVFFKQFRPIQFVILLIIGWFAGCAYEPLEPPEMPTYYQTINLPLTDVTLPLSDLANPKNNIYGDPDNDELYFKFSGDLDTVILTEEIFQIPAADDINFSQNFDELGESQPTFSTTVSHTTKLSEMIGIPGVLPSPTDLDIGAVSRDKLDDQRYEYEVYDRNSIPHFERVDYLTISDGTFQTEINNQLLVDLDSVRITLRNLNGSVIGVSFYENVPAGATVNDGVPGNLNGAQLHDSIEVLISAIIAGSNGQPVIIPANTDPFITMTFNLDIDEIESVTGIPLPIESSQNQALPPSKNTIFEATIAHTSTAPLDTNFLNMTIDNQMPFDLRMEVVFLNFYMGDDPLTIDTIIAAGQTVSNPKRLDGYTFRNPDPSMIVDSILVDIFVTILPNAGDTVVTIPMDMGNARIDVGVTFARLKFDALEGFFNEKFDIPPMAISNIPAGLANVNFGSVLLELTFFNEIQARTDVDLVLQGLRNGFSPRTIDAEGSIDKASEAEPVAESQIEIEIAPIFNMIPDSILVFGEAVIPSDDTSRLQVGKAFWGTYQVIVPFELKIEPMTFIPVTSSELAAIDPDTRRKIRQGLIEASIVTEIINDFPFSGNLSLLMANYDYFPLEPDSLDEGYFWFNDTLFAVTDTGNVPITIDTLVFIPLPAPKAFNSDGSVKTPGFNHTVAELDSAIMEAILRNEIHYIRPRIYFDGTDDFVKVSYSDQVQILSAISFTVDTGQLLSDEDEEEEQEGQSNTNQSNAPGDTLLSKMKMANDQGKNIAVTP